MAFPAARLHLPGSGQHWPCVASKLQAGLVSSPSCDATTVHACRGRCMHSGLSAGRLFRGSRSDLDFFIGGCSRCRGLELHLPDTDSTAQ